MQSRITPCRRLQLRHRMGQSLQEHREIVDALQRGDGEAAARTVRQHVLVQGQRLTTCCRLPARR